MALKCRWVDAVNGSDANDGATEGAAWKTLEKALIAGSDHFTIFVKQGVYWLHANVTVSFASAPMLIVGIGQVVVTQPNGFQIQHSVANGIHWHNIIFANSGDYLIKHGTGTSTDTYLNNCVVFEPKLIQTVNSINCYAANVTTPSGTTLDTPASATDTNVFYDTAGTTVINQYRCGAESGTTISGSFVNPSDLFSSLFGAYPVLPNRLASAALVKFYPPNVSADTVKSTSGDGYMASMPQQAGVLYEDPHESNYGYRTLGLSASIASATRYNIDCGSAVIAEGVYVVNAAQPTNYGVQNFILQGSNSATAFAETTYATDTNWTTIGSGSFTERDPTLTNRSAQVVEITNSTPYRYYSIKLVDNHGGSVINVGKLLLAVRNEFTQCDLDTLKIGDTEKYFFPASSTGWAEDSSYTSGTIQIDDYGIALLTGDSVRAISPVYEFQSSLRLRNIATSGTYGTPATVMEFRVSTGSFLPEDVSPTWTTYTRDSTVDVAGTYLQYRFTLFAQGA